MSYPAATSGRTVIAGKGPRRPTAGREKAETQSFEILGSKFNEGRELNFHVRTFVKTHTGFPSGWDSAPGNRRAAGRNPQENFNFCGGVEGHAAATSRHMR